MSIVCDVRGCRCRHDVGPASLSRAQCSAGQSAASFSFFNTRVLILTVAGLAANARSIFGNGSIPVRVFFAGTLITLAFSRPGSVKEPSPFPVHGREHCGRQRRDNGFDNFGFHRSRLRQIHDQAGPIERRPDGLQLGGGLYRRRGFGGLLHGSSLLCGLRHRRGFLGRRFGHRLLCSCHAVECHPKQKKLAVSA